MRRPRITIVVIGLAAVAATAGITAATAAGSPASSSPPARSAPAATPGAAATVRTALANGGREDRGDLRTLRSHAAPLVLDHYPRRIWNLRQPRVHR